MISDIFCKIIKGELNADKVYQDEDFLAIKDIHPQAPVHLLIIPVKHFEDIHDMIEKDQALFGKAMAVADRVAHEAGLTEKGYRLIINEGEHGGKLVPHLHMHILGGKRLGPKVIQ